MVTGSTPIPRYFVLPELHLPPTNALSDPRVVDSSTGFETDPGMPPEVGGRRRLEEYVTVASWTDTLPLTPGRFQPGDDHSPRISVCIVHPIALQCSERAETGLKMLTQAKMPGVLSSLIASSGRLIWNMELR